MIVLIYVNTSKESEVRCAEQATTKLAPLTQPKRED
jgi:hypothetical protein